MAKKNIIPAGNLDLENDPLAIKSGDYRGALDVTPISDGNGNTVSYEPVLGNQLAYDIGAAFAQEKIVRFTLPLGTVGAPIPPVFDLYFSRPCYVSLASSVQFISDSSPAILYNNAVSAISGAIPSASISAFTIDGVSITFNVAILGSATYENFWEWSVTNNPSATVLGTFLTIQEAIDAGSAGLFKPINFFDLLGNQYYFGATVSDAVTEVPITAVLDNGTGLVQLTVPNNGIVDGTAISINGVTDGLGNSLTGEWIAYKKVVGATVDLDNIVLVGSAFNAPYTILPTAHINTNYNSVGCIGVAQEDVYNNSFNNWNLIQSKKLNFRTKKQIHSYLENDTLKTSLYFTDDFNPIRVMYYYGEFMTNGFLTFVNPQGRYDYDTVGTESRLFLGDTDAILTYDRTNDTSGQLLTGNYRYTARFVTEYQTVSPWLPLSDIINIYSYVNDGTQATIQTGDPDGFPCSKSNVLTITNIASGFYKYIEIGYVLYQGIGQSAFSIGQQLITGSNMTITHTGFETTSPIDFGTLVSADTGASYVTAKSIDALNNRLIISNLTTQQVTDFSAFFETWTHSLVNEEIEGMGVNNVGGDTGAGGNPGNDIYASYGNPEYFNPNNTYSKKGFVHNETYRFGARVKLKNGKFLSNIFWIDDVRIDTSIDNLLANPTSNRRVPFLAPYPNGTNSGGGLVDYSIYYAPNTNPLITKIKWSNIDWNFIVGGQRAIDLIETIYIYQVEMTSQYKEILGTGIYLLYSLENHKYDAAGNGWNTAFNDQPQFGIPNNGVNAVYTEIGEYNVFSGCNQVTSFQNRYNGSYLYNTVGRHYAALYSPDNYFNNENISFKLGDQLLNAELNISPSKNIDPAYQQINANAFTSKYHNIYGPLQNTSILNSNTIIEQQNIAFGGSANFASTNINVYKTCKWKFHSGNKTYDVTFSAPASPVFYFSNTNPDNESGMKYAQYYRPKGYYVKFGPKAESVYVPTGSSIHSPRVANIGTLDTYGDAFVQGQYLKLRTPPVSPYPSSQYTNTFYTISWGYGCLFYSQNRVNSQMRYPQGGVTNRNKIAPGFGDAGWERPVGSSDEVPTQYTQSYTNRNQLNQLAAYDPNVIETNSYPTRIAYSQNKPNGSFTDPYRTFLLVDCRDLEQVNGEIVHHCISNGELLTWQQRSFQRQYFQSNGMFPNLNGSEVILGDGAALSRRGLTLSSIGCSNKWSVVKGASKGGNDVVSWWNTEYGYVVRFGYDGVNPISVVHNINGFIDKNTKWSALRDTPADDEGIHGVWNDERKEYIWTSRARRNNKGLYNPNEYYVAGDSVYDYAGGQVPNVYNALRNTIQQYNFPVPPQPVTVQNPTFNYQFPFWTNDLVQNPWVSSYDSAGAASARFENIYGLNATNKLHQTLSGVGLGGTYIVKFTVKNFTNISSGLTLTVYLGDLSCTTPFTVTANGTYFANMVCGTAGSDLIFSVTGSNTGDILEIDNVSVSQLGSSVAITNAGFSSNLNGWIQSPLLNPWTQISSAAQFYNTTSLNVANSLFQNLSGLTVNNYYRIGFDVQSYANTSTTLNLRAGLTGFTSDAYKDFAINATGQYYGYVQQQLTGVDQIYLKVTTSDVGDFVRVNIVTLDNLIPVSVLNPNFEASIINWVNLNPSSSSTPWVPAVISGVNSGIYYKKWSTFGTTPYATIRQNIGVTHNVSYDITFDVIAFNNDSGSLAVDVSLGGSLPNTIPITGTGTYTTTIVCGPTVSLDLTCIAPSGLDSIVIDNVTVASHGYTIPVTTSYPLSDPNYWSLDTDPKHRNEYTLCFNELKNGFVCNYSFIPKIYGKWKKGYVSSSPFQNSSIFIHNRGDYASWYLQSLLSNPFMLGVMNEGADVKKDFVAIELNSQIKPSDVPNKAMEFFTEQHYSYLDLADFDSDELHDILWSSWIKNDATVTVDNPLGLNDLDTSSIFGQYLLWKYYFKQGVYNKLFEVNLKFEPRTRFNNT